MGLKKGQTNNKAGRPKGKLNKTTTEIRAFVQHLLEDNQQKIKRDLQKLKPYQRLIIIEKLMQYVIPKQQSIDIRAQIEAEYDALADLLEKAPSEAIDEIVGKINELRSLNLGNK